MAQLKLITQQPSIELPVSSKDGSNTKINIIVGFKRHKTLQAAERQKVYESIVSAENFDINDSQELDQFLKEEILYFKKVKLTAEDDQGKIININILDSRSAKAIETLWDNSDDCLNVLLDSYLEWTSWRVSFIEAVQVALVDTDFISGKIKN